MLIVDPPAAEGHGRLWSHLASDASFEELHAFARELGIPERGFDRDHYDIPAEWYPRAVAAGACPVSSKELVARLHAAGLRRQKARTLGPRRPGRSLLRPPRLRRGDLVAVVLPAGPVRPDRLHAGVEVLRGWGLRVRLPTFALHAGPDWLAAPDEHRAVELAAAWSDPEVRAVWAARGGYGTQRVLDLLDWTTLAAAGPQVLVGFSDITALHQAVGSRLGLATVHAPGVAALGEADLATLESVRGVLLDGRPMVLPGTPRPGGGTVEGVTVGGNVTVLAASAGTAFTHPAAGGIALLEDVGERPYRLDRALTQLVRSGWFDGVRGVALGSFTSCGEPAGVRAVLEERLAPLGVPVVHGLPVGHLPTNLPVPLGVPARLDASAGTLTVSRALL